MGPRSDLDRCGKSRQPTGIRSPDRPACNQSLYRLHYPAHDKARRFVIYFCHGCCSQIVTLCLAMKPIHVRQTQLFTWQSESQCCVRLNPLKPELNPICYFLALLEAHHFLHVSRIRVKLLTFRLLMSYICGAPILDVSRSHTTTQHSR